MPIPTSAAFKVQAAVDSNLPACQVAMLIGDYANSVVYGATATASSVDASGNFPAAGAINGDRTELNIGAAATADNGIGLSSWRSANAPAISGDESLTVKFNTPRTFNRIKLYQLSGHGLKAYSLFTLDFSGNLFAIGGTTGHTFGGQLITTTGKLDVIDFPTQTNVWGLFLLVFDTQVTNDKANVVEIEVYRKVDITSRVMSTMIQSSRDYKYVNPMATTARIVCDNSDRFFSPNHNPTPAEIALGFVNNELRPNLGIIIYQGFNLYSAPVEVYQTFVGVLDQLDVVSSSRQATLSARDPMKTVLNFVDSCNLKTAIDIGDAILYTLNRANISTWETAIDETGINIDYFFTDQAIGLDTIQSLVQGSGDSIFYFDQNGYATFKFFTQGVTQQHVYTSQTDWQAGTLTAIDTVSIPGDMLLDFTSTSARTPTTFVSGTSGWDYLDIVGNIPTPRTIWTVGADGLQWQESHGNTNYYAEAQRSISTWFGRWDCTFKLPANNATIMYWHLCEALPVDTKGTSFYVGYAIRFARPSGVPTLYLVRRDHAAPTFTYSETILASATITVNTHDTITVSRSQIGLFNVSQNGTLLFSATDTTYGGFFTPYTGFEIQVNANDIITFGNATYYTPQPFVGDNILPVLDTGVLTTGFGLLTDTSFKNSGNIYYKSRSGPTGHAVPDGSWTAWSAAFSASSQIPSLAQRYLQIDVFLDSTPESNFANPDILDITVNWSSGTGSPKYPLTSSFTFAFNSSLLDIQQQISDTLGGDSAIYNDVLVQAQPTVLAGNTTDTIWQGTVGTPPTNIASGTPLAVTNGVYTFPISTSGMDISLMTGSNPAAAVVTFAAGAAGSWIFSVINPTAPVLQITITNPGNITDLRVIGKNYANATYIQIQESKDAISTLKYGPRQLSITNNWIVSAAIAKLIANALLAAAKNPTNLIPQSIVRFEPDLLIGDRLTMVDLNLDMSGDYIAVGVTQTFDVQGKKIDTTLSLLAVP